MIGIMSISRKFMEYNPNELINIVKDNSKYVKGFEVYINYNDDFEINYLKELAFLCKKNDLLLQIHGNSNLDLDTQYKYLNILEDISNQLEYKINVVMHPIYSDNIDESINKTIMYTNSLIENIDNDKITISLENLNDTTIQDRLNKNDITPIVINNEKLYMTYDIGHEIIDGGNITDLNSLVIPFINNVHIHSNNYIYDGGFDHKPIFKNDSYWNKIIKSLIYLKSINYNGSIVFEYDLFACNGDTLENKIVLYCNSIDYVYERII